MAWDDEARRAAELFEQGDHIGAAQIFASICNGTEAGEFDRAVMGVNLATVYGRLGRVDDALASYDFSIALVLRPYVFIQESHAAFLLEKGLRDEAIAVWEHLLGFPQLAEDRRAAIEQNLATARAAG